MTHRFAVLAAAILAVSAIVGVVQAQAPAELEARLDRLEADVIAAEDVSAIKRLS